MMSISKFKKLVSRGNDSGEKDRAVRGVALRATRRLKVGEKDNLQYSDVGSLDTA